MLGYSIMLSLIKLCEETIDENRTGFLNSLYVHTIGTFVISLSRIITLSVTKIFFEFIRTIDLAGRQ